MTPRYPIIPFVRFKDIPGFPGCCAGDDGTAWTCKAKGGNCRTAGRTSPTWRRLRTHLVKGYHRVNLTRDGENHSRLLHQLILETFVGPCPDGMEACHYPDADKGNNRLENLRWDTHPENMKDAYRDRPEATEKACRRCKLTKPVAEFYGDKRASDGLKTECKSCHKEVTIATRDPEKKRRANREFMRRRRAIG